MTPEYSRERPGNAPGTYGISRRLPRLLFCLCRFAAVEDRRSRHPEYGLGLYELVILRELPIILPLADRLGVNAGSRSNILLF
jgi:hypothetical protein